MRNRTETGLAIKELRLQAGFTQKELAEALHVTDKAVSKWERGLSAPDTLLLPKLSLLLDTDIEKLISKNIDENKWIGLIDIKGCDFSQPVYDKPLIYYILVHFMLLGINRIHVLSTEENQEYLERESFKKLGLDISFEVPSGHRMMIIDNPWFLFGSDLTQQFRGAMLSERDTKLIPENQEPVFFFSENSNEYFCNKEKFIEKASSRTLGRGMVCLDMGNPNSIQDAATFIKTYQVNTGLLIGSLEEIAKKHAGKPEVD